MLIRSHDNDRMRMTENETDATATRNGEHGEILLALVGCLFAGFKGHRRASFVRDLAHRALSCTMDECCCCYIACELRIQVANQHSALAAVSVSTLSLALELQVFPSSSHPSSCIDGCSASAACDSQRLVNLTCVKVSRQLLELPEARKPYSVTRS